jgi:hypothetical protein
MMEALEGSETSVNFTSLQGVTLYLPTIFGATAMSETGMFS